MSSAASSHTDFTGSQLFLQQSIAAEKRLKRVLPLLVLQVRKMYRKRTKMRLSEVEEEEIAEQLEELLRSGNASDKAIRRIANEIGVNINSSPLNDDERSHFSEDNIQLVPRPPSPDIINNLTISPPSVHEQRRRVIQEDMWAKVAQIDYSDHIKDNIQRTQQKHARMQRQREALDEQVKMRESAKEAEKERDKAEHQEAEARWKRWKEEEQEDLRRIKAAHKLEKEARDQQLRDRQYRKTREQEVRRYEEEQLFKRSQEEEAKELQHQADKRKKAKEDVTRNSVINARQQNLKSLAEKQEHEHDLVLAQQYREKLNKQEAERDATLKALSARQAKQAEMGNAISASLQERAAHDEKVAINAAVERADREAAELAEKRKRSEKLKLNRIRFLQRQIDHREQLKHADLISARIEKDRVIRDAQSAAEAELIIKQHRRQVDVRNFNDVRRQIFDKQNLIPQSMTEHERCLNKRLLSRIADSEKREAVYSNFGATTPFLPESLPPSRCGRVL